MFTRLEEDSTGTLSCDVCESVIQQDVDEEDAQAAEDQDGYHYCLQHQFVSDKFTAEQKAYAKENKTTNLAGFAAWKMLQ
ncbi:MAG: hypothetical protein WC401_07735 [Bacteroidales bacterium]|jgi:hypothetical protein